MENAKKIWIDYRSGVISEKEATNLLLELLFKNKTDFGLAAFDEDTFSDFIVFMNSRFLFILRKYNPDISDFATYLHSVVNLTAFWWKRRNSESNIRNYCCYSMCLEENFSVADYSPAEKDFYIEEPEAENLIPVACLAKAAMRNLNLKASKRRPITKEKAKEIVKVLALKSCNNIKDEQVEIVSEITGIPVEKLHKMILQAEETLKLKKDRLAVLQNKRNFAYFQRKRKILREKNLKDYYSDPEKQDHKKTELKWQKAIDDIRGAAPCLVPSNITVGKLLNMSPRRVQKIVEEAKENFKEVNIVNSRFE